MSQVVATVLIVVIVLIFLMVSLFLSTFVVREKEVVIIERFGRFHSQLTAGVHFVIPWVDWPRRYTFRYTVTNDRGFTELIEKKHQSRISTQNEVLDFPRQNVITRDNAMIFLDAVLSYRIVSPKTMIYSVANLPNMLSKLLQAQIRNVAGLLDVDQIIEDTAAMDRVSGLMDAAAAQWGVKVEFVKIQKVEAGGLSQVLAQKKQADLNNKEVIISAKSKKQTGIIDSEARGQAQAVVNAATAEAKSVKEIARVVARYGENPTNYLLALKYMDALKKITQQPNTKIYFLPYQTALVQTLQNLGINTVLPPPPAPKA